MSGGISAIFVWFVWFVVESLRCAPLRNLATAFALTLDRLRHSVEGGGRGQHGQGDQGGHRSGRAVA
jgi:hypothetical protein